ncbi:MAG: NifB/NifX family molybdenum-iron cluster-binding protein [Desulfovibrionaceae bacterium]|nr:NifB/NifX family molybdenum-iron cluster-binding protein [Desulfovibrionaceae bacterium]
MLIAVSSEGPCLTDPVDPRYGRAGGFVLADYSSEGDPKVRYLDNGDAQMLAQGAGIATTEHLAAEGVSVVLSGYVGPKALEALNSAGIRVVQNMDGMSVGQALQKYREQAGL